MPIDPIGSLSPGADRLPRHLLPHGLALPMHRHDIRALAVVAGISAVGIATFGWATGDEGSAAPAGTLAPVATTTTLAGGATVAIGDTTTTVDPAAGSTVATDATSTSDEPVVEGENEDGCVITERSLNPGDTGASVTCLQEALIAAGYLTGSASGTYDSATESAVRTLQIDKDLYVDGIAGRETGLALGVWPDEASLVVRTPVPPEGAVDLLGYKLSTVASAGDDAPPLPEDSGSGRRLVYSRAGQRVWAVDDDGRILRSWLVSGSKYNNELPGTHQVYSRSEVSTAWNGKAFLPLMVRWLKTERGAIGFHSIPLHREDNSPYQTEAELGQRLSGGCQRQAPADAKFIWEWATIGTPVVVV